MKGRCRRRTARRAGEPGGTACGPLSSPQRPSRARRLLLCLHTPRASLPLRPLLTCRCSSTTRPSSWTTPLPPSNPRPSRSRNPALRSTPPRVPASTRSQKLLQAREVGPRSSYCPSSRPGRGPPRDAQWYHRNPLLFALRVGLRASRYVESLAAPQLSGIKPMPRDTSRSRSAVATVLLKRRRTCPTTHAMGLSRVPSAMRLDRVRFASWNTFHAWMYALGMPVGKASGMVSRSSLAFRSTVVPKLLWKCQLHLSLQTRTRLQSRPKAVRSRSISATGRSITTSRATTTKRSAFLPRQSRSRRPTPPKRRVTKRRTLPRLRLLSRPSRLREPAVSRSRSRRRRCPRRMQAPARLLARRRRRPHALEQTRRPSWSTTSRAAPRIVRACTQGLPRSKESGLRSPLE